MNINGTRLGDCFTKPLLAICPDLDVDIYDYRPDPWLDDVSRFSWGFRHRNGLSAGGVGDDIDTCLADAKRMLSAAMEKP